MLRIRQEPNNFARSKSKLKTHPGSKCNFLNYGYRTNKFVFFVLLFQS